ncbi:MAG: alkaline phosphatase family protein [Thermosynechococcaceae cyanobacterium]
MNINAKRIAPVLALMWTLMPLAVKADESRRTPRSARTDSTKLNKTQHIVVIYEENHSFDNLYGGWEGVNGLKMAAPAKKTQVNQAGTPFACLLQTDVNLASDTTVNPAALSATCTDRTTAKTFASAFVNAPFEIDKYIAPTDKTCSAPNVFAAKDISNI